MNLKVTLTSWWCDWFHGGGIIKRDSADRINWQCAKCGRWADPVPADVERAVVDRGIEGGAIGLAADLRAILTHIDAQAAEIDALKVACRDAHTAEAEAMAVLLGCEEQVEQLRAALRGWDALIRFQYTGSQEAMEAMHRCAQRTNDVMKEQE